MNYSLKINKTNELWRQKILDKFRLKFYIKAEIKILTTTTIVKISQKEVLRCLRLLESIWGRRTQS